MNSQRLLCNQKAAMKYSYESWLKEQTAAHDCMEGLKHCLHGNIAQLWIFIFQGGFWTFYSGIVSLNWLRSPHYSNFTCPFDMAKAQSL